jgi:hypothetical protein
MVPNIQIRWSVSARAAMRRWLRIRITAIAAGVCLLWAGCITASASAQNSNRIDVTLQATVLNSLTLAVVNPVVAFGVVIPGTTNAAPLGQALAITSTWLLSAGQTVKLYAYFDTASSALTGLTQGDNIPTSAVIASFNGGATQTFTQTSPFTSGATATTLYSVPITASNAITAARLDSLALTLNLTGITLHPDTYTGTMHLQAQAL